MKKLTFVLLSVTSFALFGCLKTQIERLEEKGLKRLSTKQSLDFLCNGEFTYTYPGKYGNILYISTENCKYNRFVITSQGSPNPESRGTIVEGSEGKVCRIEEFGNGKKNDPPKKWCRKEVIFKTNDNEWVEISNNEKILVFKDNNLKLNSEKRLETFCNGNFEVTYFIGIYKKASLEVNECNFVWQDQRLGCVYKGTMVESPEGESCLIRTSARGYCSDPRLNTKICNKEITFKTGENEWKTFRNGYLTEKIVKK
jgi:hypothetical protein